MAREKKDEEEIQEMLTKMVDFCAIVKGLPIAAAAFLVIIPVVNTVKACSDVETATKGLLDKLLELLKNFNKLIEFMNKETLLDSTLLEEMREYQSAHSGIDGSSYRHVEGTKPSKYPPQGMVCQVPGDKDHQVARYD